MGFFDLFKKNTQSSELEVFSESVPDTIDSFTNIDGAHEFVDYMDISDSGVPVNGVIKLTKNGLELGKEAVDVYKHSQEIARDIEKIRAASLVELKNISAKYTICHELIEKVYGERREALNQHYQILDDAIKKGDREMIVHTIHGISGIVTTKPMETLKDVLEKWNGYNNKNPLQIDF